MFFDRMPIVMELIILFIAVNLYFFWLVISQLLPHTTSKNGADLGYSKRIWIIVNLLVWAYECFFMAAVCGGIKGMNVYFGGGLGDLVYFFMLIGITLLHIFLLGIFIKKKLRTVFYIILVCLPIYTLVVIHSAAARGNEKNGYMTGGNIACLYADFETYQQRKERQEELKRSKEAKADTIKFNSLLHATENGDSQSGYELAAYYKHGIGVGKNDSLAVKWLRFSAESGYVTGQLDLGECYYNGYCNLTVDYREAVKWFTKAAEQGNAKAQYLTGRCYGHGKGVKQSDEEAFKWLRLAARQGYKPAQELLQRNKQTW